MKFSFLVWNMRQYRGDPVRLDDVANHIAGMNPDVFGLLEFRAKNTIRDLMFNHFPAYDFAVTDSKMGIEIPVGWRRGKFDQIIQLYMV